MKYKYTQEGTKHGANARGLCYFLQPSLDRNKDEPETNLTWRSGQSQNKLQYRNEQFMIKMLRTRCISGHYLQNIYFSIHKNHREQREERCNPQFHAFVQDMSYLVENFQQIEMNIACSPIYFYDQGFTKQNRHCFFIFLRWEEGATLWVLVWVSNSPDVGGDETELPSGQKNKNK